MTGNRTETLSDALVFFGVTGDLAYKQIFPALQSMIRHNHFNVPVIGVAGRPWKIEQLREHVHKSLEEHGGVDKDAFDKLCSQLQYVSGNYNEEATYTKLRQALGPVQRPLYYLAIPPSMFDPVVEGLGKSGCANNARVVIEKPFGRNLASAQQLNQVLHTVFPESSIFRIDHYLGKEPAQNLLYFRFANSLFEPIWNRNYVASVQVTMSTGATRNIALTIQNTRTSFGACWFKPLACSKNSGRGFAANAVRSISPGGAFIFP